MTKDSTWTGRYLAVIILAVMLGEVLAQLPVFTETALGRLKASELVRFIGYESALVLLWVLGRETAVPLLAYGAARFWSGFMARAMPKHVPVWHEAQQPFRSLNVSLTTLVVMAGSQQAGLLLLQPLLSKTGKLVYNWLFVTGIIGAALWFAVTLFLQWEQVLALFRAIKPVDDGQQSSARPADVSEEGVDV